MADRYWVGGTGNWNDTARWSTGSGGGSGASVPTSADNVFFDDASAAGTFTVTINVSNAACANFDASGITLAARKMTLTGTASVGALQVNGNWTNPSTTTFGWTTWTGNTITFAATGTVITNAVTFVPAIIVNGSGITVTLGGALTVTGAFTLTNGSFDTSASNYAFTPPSITIAANSNTRTLTLNASSVTLAGANPYTDSSTGGFTLSAGTSTITCSSSSAITFTGGSKTFYNVTFSSGTVSSFNIVGTNTFNNFTVAARTAAGIGLALFPANVTTTINGTLSINSGAASAERRYRVSTTSAGAVSPGSQGTISAATVSLTNCDFRDIVAAGAAIPFTGTSLGNASNNSNITFTAAKTVYWSSAAGASANWNSASWATGSGGAGALANFPIPQDTVIIDTAGATTGDGLRTGNTITLNANYFLPTIDSSARASAWTFAWGAITPTFVKDFILDANVTLTGTGQVIFTNITDPQTLTMAGKSFPSNVNVTSYSVPLRINGTATLSGTTATFTLQQGTLDLTNNGAGNYTLSTPRFASSNSNTRSITFGTGEITLTGTTGTLWTTSTVTNFSRTGTPTVKVSSAATSGTLTIATGPLSESQALDFDYTSGTYGLADAAAVYRNLIFSGFAPSGLGTVPNSVRTIYGSLTLPFLGNLAGGANATTFAATSGTQNVTSTGRIIAYPIIQNNPGAILKLQDNFESSVSYTLTAGTLDVNGKTLTSSTFVSTGTATRAITFNGGTISLSGSGSTVWDASGSNFTTSAGTGVGIITLTSASSKTFSGDTFNYAAALNQGGAGTLTIAGNNTFANITATTLPSTITFTAGTTQTVSQFTASGTSGNLLTLNSSSPGSQFTLYDASGTNNVSFCSITDSNATGGATWNSLLTNGNVDGGNNLGWVFTAVPPVVTYSPDIRLRSMAERRRI